MRVVRGVWLERFSFSRALLLTVSALVAPRGHTQWVRNMRVAGGGELHLGGRSEVFAATELADEEKPAVLRAYLKRWKFEVGMFFDGVGPDASEEKLLEIAPGYPGRFPAMVAN